MPILKDVLARLSSQPAITSIVSLRIYAGILPQDPIYPALTYKTISRFPEHCFGADPGNEQARIQVDCWAITFAESYSLNIAVKNAMSRWRGSQTNYYIEDCFVENQQDEYEDESTQRVYRHSVDFMIFFRPN